MGESVAEFMGRRRREAAQFGRRAEAAAHEAYGKAIRAGQDLKLGSPGEVLRYGAKLSADADRISVAVSNTIHEKKRQAGEALNQLEQNPRARAAAIDAARGVGNAAGVVRGGVHAVQGLAEGATFVARLADPFDRLKSPQGESAVEQLSQGTLNTGQKAVDYVHKGMADPTSVVRDVNEKAQQWRRDLDPSATPVAPTFEGEIRRNFNIGQNQGELAFDVGSLVIGGPAAKAVKGFGRVSNIGNAEKYIAQGFSPVAAAHLAEPYPSSNMGHHFISRRTKLPKIFGGGPLPRSYSDGLFNKLAPPGISRGDFYELHYEVDPSFYGTSARGERWSGNDLGLKRHGTIGQLWHGSPAPLKARVGGLAAAGGGGLYDLEDGDQQW